MLQRWSSDLEPRRRWRTFFPKLLVQLNQIDFMQEHEDTPQTPWLAFSRWNHGGQKWLVLYIGNVQANSGKFRKFKLYQFLALPFIKQFIETLFGFVLSMFYQTFLIKYPIEGSVGSKMGKNLQNCHFCSFWTILDPHRTLDGVLYQKSLIKHA